MAINQLISIRGPILDAMEMLGIENRKDEPVFTRWAYQAEKEIGSRYQFIKKIAVIDIHGCVANLPQDAAYLDRALLGDYGCDCTDLFYKWCATVSSQNGASNSVFSSQAGPTFLVVDVGSEAPTMFQNVIQCEVQNNKIVLMQPHDGQKLTIQYVAYKTDCDGFLEISQNHQLAITAYICWKYYMRKKRSSNEDFYKIKEWKAEWDNQAGNARAQDSVLTESQRTNIVNMLHDPLIGIGIQTAPYYVGWNWGF